MTYRADSLEVLKGLDPVRRRPGMYTHTGRPNHLAHEVIDNAIDEALAGHCTKIKVFAHADGSLSVTDNGRGMPVDIHRETGLNGVELIMTKLHSGAKFSRGEYRHSGGLHGVGVSVVNALSEQLSVAVRKPAGKRIDSRLATYSMSFANGEVTKPLKRLGKDSAPTRETKGLFAETSGTCVRFKPAGEYFDNPDFHLFRLRDVLRTKAVLCPGLLVSLEAAEELANSAEIAGEWLYPDGLGEYLSEKTGKQETGLRLPESPVRFSSGGEKAPRREDGCELDCVVQWDKESSRSLSCADSFVNLVPTPRHGTHVNGLRTGLADAMREFCDFHSLLPKGLKLAPGDVFDGAGFVLSVKMDEPQFSGQTKEALSSRSAAAFVSETVKSQFALWLNSNVKWGEKIAQRAIEQAQKRINAAKRTARKSAVSGPPLPGKLADCSSTDAPQCEVFLVEGDSAGGSARQARSRDTQAILPLRGKIMNTWEASVSKAMSSKEIQDIATALGIAPGSSDLEGLRYGKVCILADADSDGLHIATLICALFVRHFPSLIANGHVYVVKPPLYRIDVGKQKFYALSDSEREAIEARFAGKKGKTPSVTRFKGLGEMSASQLRETAMSPETRNLVRLDMGQTKDASSMLDMLLAKKRAGDRRRWLETRGNMRT